MNPNGWRNSAEAPPYWPQEPQPTKTGHRLRLLQLAQGEVSPPPQDYVDAFPLPLAADESIEDVFYRLNIGSPDDYYNHHQHGQYDHHDQLPYSSKYADFQSPNSLETRDGRVAPPSDTYDHEWFASNPYLSYLYKLSLMNNSNSVKSNRSPSNSFGDACGVNGTVRQNFDTSRSNVGYGRYYRPQEHWPSVPVEELRGHIADMAKNQDGCRVLQNTMECLKHAYEIEMIFDEVIKHVCELMTDPFGNYVVQKLVELCDERQRTLITAVLTRNHLSLIRICLDMHGTRVVQKLLEHVTSRLQVALFMRAVSPYATVLCKSPSGQHVVQYCVKHFSAEDTEYLLDEVAYNLVEIATSKSGCCVLQQCVEFSRGYSRERLVNGIIANAILLSEDRYGNYVVQHLLSMKIPGITRPLLIQLSGSHMSLSTTKYGSNVVERSLREANEVEASGIILELLSNPRVPSLLTDEFGNYVIQTAVTVSKGDFRKALKTLVEDNIGTMRSNLYGKKVLGWFEKKNIPLNQNKHTGQVQGKKTV